MYQIIQKRKIFLTISGIIVGSAILALIFWGLKPGLDFTGGTMMQLKYSGNMPTIQETQDKLKDLNLGQIDVQFTGDNGAVLRFKEIDEATHQKILEKLGKPEEVFYKVIGPTIGGELTKKARWAVLLVNSAILIYIAWSFRKLSKIIRKGESWRYGAGAILAVIHDVMVMLGLFAILGHFKGIELNSTFITAVLTVLGYSVNDTIVVYDRIRENFIVYGGRNFEDIVNRSLNETIVRSFATTLTTLLALAAIFIFGSESIRYFILAMMVGIATGAWSSISIASPFLLFKRK